MGHTPHIYVPGPWDGDHLVLSQEQAHHMDKVLRRTSSAAVTYTDGDGHLGDGLLTALQIERGAETLSVAPLPALTVAVAPPSSHARVRFIVEKLSELGVDELRWLRTAHGQGRPPRNDKAHAWAVAALQQSRGAHLMRVGAEADVADLAALPGRWMAAQHGAGEATLNPGEPVGVAIGPEGGLTPDELDMLSHHIGLGSRVLRTETAAVVAAATCLRLMGRS